MQSKRLVVLLVFALSALLADRAMACWECGQMAEDNLGCYLQATGMADCHLRCGANYCWCRGGGICADGCFRSTHPTCKPAKAAVLANDTSWLTTGRQPTIQIGDELAAKFDQQPPEIAALLWSLVGERGIEAGTFRGKIRLDNPKGHAARLIEFSSTIDVTEQDVSFEIHATKGSTIKTIRGTLDTVASVGEFRVYRREEAQAEQVNF